LTTQRSRDSAPGARLRRNVDRLLAAKGWTPRQLYDAMGVASSTYSSYFKTRTGPSSETLRRLAASLDVEVAELLK
jgi:transcriptional regulator with XRE-family HTH domain